MADYLTTDTELTSVANAIRTKGGTSASLVYPAGFVSAIEAIPTGGGGTYQAKTNINPTTSSQTITPDSGYDALSSVQINAMPSGTAGTPTATKGTVSNHAVSVTPSVTNTTGYITGSTKTGTAVSVSASELVSGTLSITNNGTYDVTNYASANVNVSGGGGITLKRIAGTGTNSVNVSGWGGNDFITPSALGQNPPKIVFANFTYAGIILPACARLMDRPQPVFTLVGARYNEQLFRAEFTTSGSSLNYNSITLSHFYIGGSSDYKNNVGTWEIYSNVQSVAQFSFVIEFESEPVDTYQADEGLTWDDWIHSDYNADQLYQIDGENVLYDDGSYQMYVCDSNLDPVTIDMEIIENETYQLVMM